MGVLGSIGWRVGKKIGRGGVDEEILVSRVSLGIVGFYLLGSFGR